MKKKLIIIMICLVFGFMGLPAGVQSQPLGQGNIKLGPLEIHPSLGLTETYTDNVYRSYDGKDNEYGGITTLSPGIQLVLPLRRHSIKLGYSADINWYSHFSENDYVHQTATGSVNLDFPGGLLLTVSDNFIDSEVVRKWRKQPGLSGSADPYRALPYTSNDFLTKAKYSFADRWSAAVWYNYYKYEYDRDYDSSGNYNRNLGGGSIFYRFTPKTDVLVEFQHSKVDYPESSVNDNSNNTVYLGLGFDPTSKLSGYLKAGWTEKKYDVKAGRKDDRIDGFSTQIDLAYNLSPYDLIRFKGMRTIEEDADTNQPFTRDDYSLGYSHILSMNEKIRLNALAGFGKNKYEGQTTDIDGILKKRDENILYTRLGVDYAMQRWLMWSLGYSYQKQDSNFIRYDYYENRVFLNATLSF